jgi:hypothetical protein
MLASLATWFGWSVAIFLVIVTFLLATNRASGLKLVQHQVEFLPQAMLVRYIGLSTLALIAVVLNAPRMFFAMMLSFAVISLGDLYIYRRAGQPFWMHAIAACISGVGAVLALFSFN